MADSNITKQALAAALRGLMEEESFDKIQVAYICERCNMNRKSFYYHFKDKYDLLNWIFDTEIISFTQKYAGAEKMDRRMEIIREICVYFYENRNFYRKALKIKGQNAFSEHFREYIVPILKIRLTDLMGESTDDFALNFFADAAVCTLERWLLDKDCMSPDEFTDKLFYILQQGGHALQREFQQNR